jgi:hypothetical protein
LKRITLILILLFPLVLLSQEKKDFFLDEVTLSGNHTFGGNGYIKGHVGFGAGIYHVFIKDHMLNILFGVEYNWTGQVISYLDSIPPWNYFDYNVTFQYNNISLPLELRFSFGNKTRFYFEAGGYVDFPLYTCIKGTYRISYLKIKHDSSLSIFVNETEIIDEEHGSQRSAGLIFGAGVIIPVSKISIILKSDYKYGLGDISYGGYETMKSRYIRLSAGIRLNHTKK